MSAAVEGLRNERLTQRGQLLDQIRDNYQATAILREKLAATVENKEIDSEAVQTLENELAATKLPPLYKEIGHSYGTLVLEDAHNIQSIQNDLKNGSITGQELIAQLIGFVPAGKVEIEYESTRVKLHFNDQKDFYRLWHEGSGLVQSARDEELRFAGFYARRPVRGMDIDVCCISRNFFDEKEGAWRKMSEASTERLMSHEEQHAMYSRLRRSRYLVENGKQPDQAIYEEQRLLAQSTLRPLWYKPGSYRLDAEAAKTAIDRLFQVSLKVVSERAADEILATIYTPRWLNIETMQKEYSGDYVAAETENITKVLSLITGERLFGYLKDKISEEYIQQVMSPLKEILDKRIAAGLEAVKNLQELGYSEQEIVHLLVLELLESWPKTVQRIKSISNKKWLEIGVRHDKNTESVVK